MSAAQHTPGAFRVSYRYDNPSSAGPFKGSMTAPKPFKRGDMIRAPFGAATVISCRALAKAQEAAS